MSAPVRIDEEATAILAGLGVEVVPEVMSVPPRT